MWITVANWADALGERFGAAEVVIGSKVYSAEEVRRPVYGTRAFQSASGFPHGVQRNLLVLRKLC